MGIAYLDCPSGISGDMTLAALVDCGVDLAAIQSGVDSLGLPGCRLAVEEVKRHGFRALHLLVEHEPEHKHRHLHHITAMIDGSRLSEPQKSLAREIFSKLAQAEAKVHGTTVEKVHFHEVGAVDSIADIVGAAIGFDLLGVDRVACSPIPTGHGSIEIAHGRCSLPAPATAELLRGIPLAPSPVAAELTTPTGAAIAASLVDQFGPLPPMTIERIGYGAGSRDLAEQANVLRLIVGTVSSATGSGDERLEVDQVAVLETNLDDLPAEIVGHCMQLLLAAGALDVYTTAIQMKKNRPATKLTVLCAAADRNRIENLLFHETTTLGVRHQLMTRSKLPRETVQVDTAWGRVAGIAARLPGGMRRFSPEFDACQSLATEHDVPVQQVMQAARLAWLRQSDDSGA